FFSSRRRHTRSKRDWSSDVCSSDLHPSGTGRGRAVNGNHEGDVLLRVEHVKKYFPIRKGVLLQREVARVHAVDDVSFDLRSGERSEERRVGKSVEDGGRRRSEKKER